MTVRDKHKRGSFLEKIQIQIQTWNQSRMQEVWWWVTQQTKPTVLCYIITKGQTAKFWTVATTFHHSSSMPWKCKSRSNFSSYKWKNNKLQISRDKISKMCLKTALWLNKVVRILQVAPDEHLRSLARTAESMCTRLKAWIPQSQEAMCSVATLSLWTHPKTQWTSKICKQTNKIFTVRNR